jgi:hypothetical protein
MEPTRLAEQHGTTAERARVRIELVDQGRIGVESRPAEMLYRARVGSMAGVGKSDLDALTGPHAYAAFWRHAGNITPRSSSTG